MKNLVQRLIILGICGFASLAYGGDKTGNGGDGVLINGKVYSLDLVEAGVEQNPYIDFTLKTDPRIEAILQRNFSDPSIPLKEIGSKLTELRNLDPVFTEVILFAIGNYQWNVVNAPLEDVDDENSPIPREDLRQVAIRRNRSILISRPLFEAMNPSNRAGLILHELLYAIVFPRLISKGHPERAQDSLTARELNGYLFSENLRLQGHDGLYKMALNWFPTLYSPINHARYQMTKSGDKAVMAFNPGLWVAAYDWNASDFNLVKYSYSVQSPDLTPAELARLCLLNQSKTGVDVTWFEHVWTHQMSIDHFIDVYGLTRAYVRTSGSDQGNVAGGQIVKFKSVADCKGQLPAIFRSQFTNSKSVFDRDAL